MLLGCNASLVLSFSFFNKIKPLSLQDLVGGITSVTLGDDEARRRHVQKSILERKGPPTFSIAVEMESSLRWKVHRSVALAVDDLLQGRQVMANR